MCFLACLWLTACSDKPEPEQKASVPSAKQENESAQETPQYLPALQQEIAYTWHLLIESTQALNEQIKQFSSQPSDSNFEAVMTIWQQAHAQYRATDAYTYLQLPLPPAVIDQDGTPLHRLHTRIDQYPLIPGYLDAVQGYPQSGLIYTEMPLTEESIANEHQLGDIAYVAMGFHALEFILTGDKSLNLSLRQRFGAQESNSKTTEDKSKAPTDIKRRKQYITLLGQLLLKDLTQLQAAWTSPEGHYYKALRQLPARTRQKYILRFVEREQAVIQELRKKSDDHIGEDAIALRHARIDKLLKAFAELESANTGSNESATPE